MDDVPPDYYFVDKAARFLRMSFVELDEHPRKYELMQIAATLEYGENEGENVKRCNPIYQKRLQEMAAAEHRARGGK